jgi:endonuclease/exonuclease/phosphatase family metal-dependent hydrolase
MATSLIVQNNTTHRFEVHTRLSGDSSGRAWRAAGTTIASGERRRIGHLARWSGVPRHATLALDTTLRNGVGDIHLSQHLTGGRWRNALRHRVQGGPWWEDGQSGRTSLDLAEHVFLVACHQRRAGLDRDLEIVLDTQRHRAPAGRDTLDVLAYNVWLRPSIFLNGQAQRAARLPDHLRGHDVVVLTEAFHPKHAPAVIAALADEYPHQTAVLGDLTWPWPFGPGAKLWNGGVVLLSRWPIERTETRSFRGHLLPTDRWADKGALYACINKLGRRYHLLGTHVQADAEPYLRPYYRLTGRDPDRVYWDQRRANFSVVRGLLDDVAPPCDEPVLITGDLNTCRVAAPWQHAEMLAILDAAEPAPGDHHPYTFDTVTNRLASVGPPAWLDYVLFSRRHLEPLASEVEVHLMRARDGWRGWLGGPRWDLSDHYAVSSRMTFPPPATA